MNTETISKIVKASGVSAGEMILIHFWGEDKDKNIANQFLVAVASLGATPVLLQQSRTINRDIFSSAKNTCFDERYFNLFSSFDAVLDIFTYQPVKLGYTLPESQVLLYRQYMSNIFDKFIGCKRFTQIRIPTIENAKESCLEPNEYIERMTRAYDVDYEQIKKACTLKLESLNGVKQVALHTGRNCILNFDLTDRVWHIDAGDGDLPCGEIYIAPNEQQTDGSVFFETFYLNGKQYQNVKLDIKDGEVCVSNNAELMGYFEQQPRENRIVCELGMGMNPNVTNLCGYSVLDEKMAGSFHIAVGANTMFGGQNKATCHNDFVCQGSIEVIKR